MKPTPHPLATHLTSERLYIVQDSDDPLLFLVTDERADNAIRVIPTARALAMWDYRASTDTTGHHNTRSHHPSVQSVATTDPLPLEDREE